MSSAFGTIMEWADDIRRMAVRTNAETPADARTAVGFGAEGIGLCRTEHMFFDVDRIIAMREMIMAVDSEGREAALAKLLPMQRQDFEELFTIMAGLPVTIRLLDPPLHEFLPHSADELADVAAAAGIWVSRFLDCNYGRKGLSPYASLLADVRGCLPARAAKADAPLPGRLPV